MSVIPISLTYPTLTTLLLFTAHKPITIKTTKIDKLTNRVNSITVKFRSLYFSKALFEGLIFGGAYIRGALSTEGNLRFKIDWASLIVGVNLPFLLCFTLYLRGLIFGGAI